ncbi:MAG TPA: ABC transporter ATP-binding protein [Clostridia bacterium]|nr:ABC transporter ATP-binding protein [Clostridia bacterium]
MEKCIIRAANLSKKYNSGFAVRSLNMLVKKGEIYGLIGQNGAGKTTLFRILMGLVHPTSGEIELWGKNDEASLMQSRKRMGSIIEMPSFYLQMTAKQNLELVRLKRGIPGKDCIMRCLKEVDLEDAAEKKVCKFSLGMKQRLGIAAALLSEPEILVLDEPINGLDPIGIVQIRELFKRINRERGVTILISSHILSEIYQTATCYGIMKKGVLIEELTAEELNKKNRKCLEIIVDDASKATTVIDRELNTSNYEVLPGNKIHLFDHVEQSGLVNSKLNKSMITVESITPIGEDLEDYFIKIAGGDRSVCAAQSSDL